MPKPNARLTVRLTPRFSNVGPERRMALIVEDAASDRKVIEVELLGEHLMDLLGNRQVGGVDGVPAWLIEPDDRHALGKLNGVTSRRFPISRHDEVDIHKWCATHAPVAGAHTWRFSKNNMNMFVVNWTHYLDVRTEDELDAVMRQRQDAMDLLPEPESKQ